VRQVGNVWNWIETIHENKRRKKRETYKEKLAAQYREKVTLWKGIGSITRYETKRRRRKAHGNWKTTAIEKKLRNNAGNDGTLSVYFLYYVVYSFDHV
jgi:hypothetical protein